MNWNQAFAWNMGKPTVLMNAIKPSDGKASAEAGKQRVATGENSSAET
jgi:hypothetical protein